jgi:hypothetical protein
MIGELAAAPGAIDGKAGIDQVAVIGAGAGGIDRRMFQQPHQLLRLTLGDGGGACFHLRHSLGIGDGMVGYPPRGAGLQGRVQIKLSETIIRHPLGCSSPI